MSAAKIGSHVTAKSLLAVAASALAVAAVWGPTKPPVTRTSVIVQARDMGTASAAVRAVGGDVTRELPIIDAVAATVTPDEARRLAGQCAGCRLYPDGSTRLMGSGVADTAFPTLIGATSLHSQGFKGQGITVAVLDSGLLTATQYLNNSAGYPRVKAQYDAFTNVVRTGNFVTDDTYGHGSHVTGIIASSSKAYGGKYNGIAPDAGIVSVRAFDQNGGSTYATVIQAIGWVVANKSKYGIRVLNASFGAPVASWYWDDPMNQAIMKAWKAGIVVVVSAGNTGPGPMTIQAPGNVPYVITVGAMTDNYTPQSGNDDSLATFSAAGPTFEAFAKPDLVAPGGHDLSWISRTSTLGIQFPQYFTETTGNYYRLSGTSQAAAVVSGVAALMLQADPWLSPDDVKCGLMATATAAKAPGGASAYSVFQQGAGLVRALSAVNEGRTGCANNGLDIAADLAGTRHFGGPAGQDANGNYYLMDQAGSGTTWAGNSPSTGGYPWANGFPWSNGYPWSAGYTWSNGFPWSNGYPWSTSIPGATSARHSQRTGARKGIGPSIGSGVTVVKPAPQE